jgi:hypothetical protein
MDNDEEEKAYGFSSKQAMLSSDILTDSKKAKVL